MKRLLFLAVAIFFVSAQAAFAQLSDADVAQFRKELNDLLSQSIDGTVIFASQGSISAGHYTVDEGSDPDSHFEVLRIPFGAEFGAEGDRFRFFFDGLLGYFHGTSQGVAPEEFQPLQNDFSVFRTYSANAGGGVNIKILKDLTLSPAMNFIYSRTTNDYDYNNIFSQTILQLFDKILFNWHVNTVTYVPSAKLAWKLPIKDPQVTLSAKYSYIRNTSTSSNSPLIDVNTHSGMLNTRAEWLTPLDTTIQECPLFLQPYVVRTDLYGDVRRALDPSTHFWEVGIYLKADTSKRSSYLSSLSVGASYTFAKEFDGYNVGIGANF